MKAGKKCHVIIGIVLLLLYASIGNTQTIPAGEEALFATSIPPDALLLLDLSGSMDWNPAGDNETYGATDSCTADTTNCNGSGCSNGFCSSAVSGTTYYANSSCSVADTTNCQGNGCDKGFCTNSHTTGTYYAATTCGVADTANCSGGSCGRTDGFCNTPVAGSPFYAHDSTCVANIDQCSHDVWNSCKNGFCSVAKFNKSKTCTTQCTTTACNKACTVGSCNKSCTSGGCSSKCSRINIAKRAMFGLLDADGNGTINAADESNLGVRIGYMKYYNCSDDEDSIDYNAGCNRKIREIGSKYSLIFCNSSTSCTATSGYGNSSTATSLNAEDANNGTPAASALAEAKKYLDDNKAADDPYKSPCRDKFVIFITDGSDTFSCSASGSECAGGRYKNRREVVAKAKALADAGYKLFVIGFGSAMPPYLRNTLNWMAYYGKGWSDSAKSGDTSAYNIPAGTGNIYPAGITSCMTDGSPQTAKCYDSDHPYYTGAAGEGISTANYSAASNDPGYLNLSGYAFLASNTDELKAALRKAVTVIQQSTHSFSQASVQSNRTTDENFIYQGLFLPSETDPFWQGHLLKYTINADESVGALSATWTEGDAGAVLRDTGADSRFIKTYLGGSLSEFTKYISPLYFGFATNDATTQAARDMIVGFVRGDPAYNKENWKLGDIFRDAPITIGTPSLFFDDYRDLSSTTVASCCLDSKPRLANAYGAFRCTHCRTSANTSRVITIGANDGQFHVFKTSNGTEVWSFIPPNLLPKLANIAHSTHPATGLTHSYFVDGQAYASDAWLGTGDGLNKNASDWHSVLVFGEGRGAMSANAWSSSSSCDSGFNDKYSPNATDSTKNYVNYCGYWALNMDYPAEPAPATTTPRVLWRLNFSSTDESTLAPYLGYPWNKFTVGRIRERTGTTETERWVAFIGAGYNSANCAGTGTCDTRGKGFFVVDMRNGQVIWSYTKENNGNMVYSMPGGVAAVDTDNDGFVDTAYAADLGGNMWRFKFCTKSQFTDASGSNKDCSRTNWAGGILFASRSADNNIRPVYTKPSVATDTAGNRWVYFATGDKTDPTFMNAAGGTVYENIYGVKDNDRTSSYNLGNTSPCSFTQMTSTSRTYVDATNKCGWYMTLSDDNGEKVLTDPNVFGGVLYMISFVPAGVNATCNFSGTSYIYGFKIINGGSSLPGNANKISLGTGYAGTGSVSVGPSGKASIFFPLDGKPTRFEQDLPNLSNRTNMLYWKDKRIQ